MAERFTRLFSLAENLYTEGSPILIAAGALQKDNQTEKIFAQLKFKNITNKTIKAVKIKLFPHDTIGNALEGAIEQEYLDLSAERGEEFGQKTAVKISNASTRGFAVEICAVYFADNSTWSGEGAEWSSLPTPESIEESLEDLELVKQYKLKYGADCEYTASEYKDLWFCTCGELNHMGKKCCVCGRELATIKNADLDELKSERDVRLEEERRKAEADREAAAAQAKKTKKTIKVIIPIAALILAVIAIFTFISKKNSSAAEKEFVEHISVSMLEATEFADNITAPTDAAKDLLELYDKYAPYCGTYTWLSMDGTAVKEYSFVSDFYVEDGVLYWVYDDSEYTRLHSLVAFYSNPKNQSKPEYAFLQSPLAVNDMKAYEKIEDDMMDMSVEFKNERIIITSGYFENYTQGSEYVITDKHYDLFSLEAEKENVLSQKNVTILDFDGVSASNYDRA
ncbi:MAG: hypothetical protein Q4G23_12350, partial [Clostridia bacterium]|nr:hypothetical protein [Clostridia bacterium]